MEVALVGWWPASKVFIGWLFIALLGFHLLHLRSRKLSASAVESVK
jgi:hypothetical protein